MSSKGFTIVEILVASAILVVIISVASGLFVSLVRHQRRVMDKQELLNQTSYIIEYMSRALRMARKDGTGVCLSVSGLNYENPLGDVSAIKFINHSENVVCKDLFLDEFEKKLNESKHGSTAFGRREPGLPSHQSGSLLASQTGSIVAVAEADAEPKRNMVFEL